MQNSPYTKPLNLELVHNLFALYFYQKLEKCVKFRKKLKKLKFEGGCAKL